MFLIPNEADENAGQQEEGGNNDVTFPSWYKRLKLQRDPWLRSLKRYWPRYLVSVALLLSQAPLIACRFRLLSDPDEKLMVSIGCWGLASIHFLLHWTLIPEMPPWFATVNGRPRYNDEDLYE